MQISRFFTPNGKIPVDAPFKKRYFYEKSEYFSFIFYRHARRVEALVMTLSNNSNNWTLPYIAGTLAQ